MKILVFDTETTGLVHNRLLKLEHQPEITEWSSTLVDLDSGEVEDDFTTLVKPRHSISDFIAKKTKIDDKTVANAPYFEDVMDKIVATIGQAPMAVAHNATFDIEMVEIELQRRDRVIMWPPVICSIEQTMHLKCKRLALGDLYLLLTGEKLKGAHRAANDVKALVTCMVELRKRGELPYGPV